MVYAKIGKIGDGYELCIAGRVARYKGIFKLAAGLGHALAKYVLTVIPLPSKASHPRQQSHKIVQSLLVGFPSLVVIMNLFRS